MTTGEYGMTRFLTLACVVGLTASPALGQKKQREEDFAKEKPAVGDPLPALTVYTPDGKEVKTADLRGHYTVLTFGCLT
jgi:cytochrome oxidase Cu insertion factor (SCO1/SenC/PrrC family)